MAAKRGKTSGSRRSTTSRKPRTIDLDAKEVKSTAGTSSTKSSIASTSKQASTSAGFGRNARADGTKSADTSAGSKKPATGSKASSSTGGAASKAPTSGGGRSTPPPSVAKKSGAGLGTAFLSAIFGSAVTVAGLGALGTTGDADKLPLIGSLYAGGASTEISAIGNDVSALKGEVAKLGAVESEVAKLGETAATLGERVEKVESVQSGATSTANPDDNAKALSDLAKSVKASNEGLSSIITKMSAQISALETQVQKQAETLPDFEALQAGVAGSQAAVTAVRSQSSELDLALATLRARIDALEGTVKSDLVSKLETVSKAAESASASEKVAKSVSLSAMQSAMDRGASYLTALASYETLTGETEDTKRLKALAGEGGAISHDMLAEEFSSLSQQMLAELSPVTKENASFMDRLVGSAKSLVTVRNSGPIDGVSPRAVMTRIQAALNDGDLEKALLEWDGLPKEAQVVGEPFLAKVKSRMEATALVQKLISNASGTG